MGLSRSRRNNSATSDGYRIEKTDHGWRVYHHGANPETRYLSPDPHTLARLKKEAERDFAGRSAHRGDDRTKS